MKLATYVRKLKDRSGNYVVPATRASCVYLDDNKNLQDWIDDQNASAFDPLTIFPVGPSINPLVLHHQLLFLEEIGSRSKIDFYMDLGI